MYRINNNNNNVGAGGKQGGNTGNVQVGNVTGNNVQAGQADANVQGGNAPGNGQGGSGATVGSTYRGGGRGGSRGGRTRGRGGYGGTTHHGHHPYRPPGYGRMGPPPPPTNRERREMDHANVPILFRPMTMDTMVHAPSRLDREEVLKNPRSGLDTHFRVPGGGRQVNVFAPANVAGQNGFMFIADANHAEHIFAQARQQCGTDLVQGFIAGHSPDRWNQRVENALWYWQDTSITAVEEWELHLDKPNGNGAPPEDMEGVEPTGGANKPADKPADKPAAPATGRRHGSARRQRARRATEQERAESDAWHLRQGSIVLPITEQAPAPAPAKASTSVIPPGDLLFPRSSTPSPAEQSKPSREDESASKGGDDFLLEYPLELIKLEEI